MGRNRWAIFVFVAGLLAVILAMAWITWHTLRLERAELAAREDAALQERVRLALWRMDSALTPVLSRESARPYFQYQSFYPADRAYTRMYKEVSKGEVLVPSPLLRPTEEFVKLYFEESSSGGLSSPQLPAADQVALVEGLYVSSYAVRAAEERLGQLRTMLEPKPSVYGSISRGGSAGLPSDRRDGVEKAGSRSGNAIDELKDDDIASRRTGVAESAIPELNAPSPKLQQTQEQQVAQNAAEFRSRAQVQSFANKARDYVNAPKSGAAQPSVPIAAAPPSATTNGTEPGAADKDGTAKEAATGTAIASAPSRESEDMARKDSKPGAVAEDPKSKKARGDDLRKAGEPEEKAREKDKDAEHADRRELPNGPTVAAPPAKTEASTPSGVFDSTLKSVPASMPGSSEDAGSAAHSLYRDADDRLGFPHAEGMKPDLSITLSSDEAPVVQEAFEPRWLGDPADPQLVMIRPVQVGATRVRQGFWLDWPQLKAWLLTQAADLSNGGGRFGVVPGASAELVPLLEGTQHAPPAVLGRTLAAIPAELRVTPTAGPVAAGLGWTPLRATLGATWIAVLLAAAAIAWVLRASLELAERRGRFVSAVTHELRTPLTTFCLYSQMLADGMVKDEDAKTSYIRTLKQESTRLAGIVESVLDYARLGKRTRTPRQDITVAALLDRVTPGLIRQCEHAGATWMLEVSGDREAICSTDPSTVERILQNLVDNACKYGRRGPAGDAGATSTEVELAVTIEPGRDIRLSVRDSGPGVSKEDRAKIFRPFVRGAQQGDGSVPGLGLGLALSRSLAREMGGDLVLDDTTADGTRRSQFTLTIPRRT